jgi:hypothetical protein
MEHRLAARRSENLESLFLYSSTSFLHCSRHGRRSCVLDKAKRNGKLLAHPALDFQLTIKTLSRIRQVTDRSCRTAPQATLWSSHSQQPPLGTDSKKVSANDFGGFKSRSKLTGSILLVQSATTTQHGSMGSVPNPLEPL